LAVLLSQFKEWKPSGKIEPERLVESR